MTKEVHNTLLLSHCMSDQIHTCENKTKGKRWKIDHQRSQGDFPMGLHKLKSVCFWGFVPDEVRGIHTMHTTLVLSPGTHREVNT